MRRSFRLSSAVLASVAALALAPVAMAQHGPEGERPGGHEAEHAGAGHGPVERERPPIGYNAPGRPDSVVARPPQIDRQGYNHNFQADHGFHIGPYHAPAGFRYRRWAYGEILPRLYWAPGYWLTDYWLFGLDVPPVGFEWVRYGPDALLIDVHSGEVIQVVYGRFQ